MRERSIKKGDRVVVTDQLSGCWGCLGVVLHPKTCKRGTFMIKLGTEVVFVRQVKKRYKHRKVD